MLTLPLKRGAMSIWTTGLHFPTIDRRIPTRESIAAARESNRPPYSSFLSRRSEQQPTQYCSSDSWPILELENNLLALYGKARKPVVRTVLECDAFRGGCSIRGGVTSQSAIKLGFKLGPSIYLSFLSNLPL